MKRFFVGLLFAGVLSAAPGGGSVSVGPLLGANLSTGPNGQTISAPLQIIILLTFLTLLPAAVMCVTPFLRISVVLHFLRQALGTQSRSFQSGPDRVGFVFDNFGDAARGHRHVPPSLGAVRQGDDDDGSGARTGWKAAAEVPASICTRKRYSAVRDAFACSTTAHAAGPGPEVLIPAYILSELKASFQIGTVLFLPFMVIDVVVASITVSMGMMQLPPAMLSAPFKILLFVLVDGWDLVVGSLMKGIYS